VTSGVTVSSVYTLFYNSDNAANTSGSLAIVSGGEFVAEIALVGHYTKANFEMVADFVSSGAASGTLEIIDPPVVSANAGLLAQYMAGGFVIAAGGFGGAAFGDGGATSGYQTLLAHPHG
jgi:hypothetical protein